MPCRQAPLACWLSGFDASMVAYGIDHDGTMACSTAAAATLLGPGPHSSSVFGASVRAALSAGAPGAEALHVACWEVVEDGQGGCATHDLLRQVGGRTPAAGLPLGGRGVRLDDPAPHGLRSGGEGTLRLRGRGSCTGAPGRDANLMQLVSVRKPLQANAALPAAATPALPPGPQGRPGAVAATSAAAAGMPAAADLGTGCGPQPWAPVCTAAVSSEEEATAVLYAALSRSSAWMAADHRAAGEALAERRRQRGDVQQQPGAGRVSQCGKHAPPERDGCAHNGVGTRARQRARSAQLAAWDEPAAHGCMTAPAGAAGSSASTPSQELLLPPPPPAGPCVEPRLLQPHPAAAAHVFVRLTLRPHPTSNQAVSSLHLAVLAGSQSGRSDGGTGRAAAKQPGPVPGRSGQHQQAHGAAAAGPRTGCSASSTGARAERVAAAGGAGRGQLPQPQGGGAARTAAAATPTSHECVPRLLAELLRRQDDTNGEQVHGRTWVTRIGCCWRARFMAGSAASWAYGLPHDLMPVWA